MYEAKRAGGNQRTLAAFAQDRMSLGSRVTIQNQGEQGGVALVVEVVPLPAPLQARARAVDTHAAERTR
ncbi:hypothetical protein B4Q13_17485, partial [Lacticaseibacillus rhamnosus]